MGTLHYGSQRVAIRIDDRLLAHLKVVILSKLRRQEPFVLNIHEERDVGSGRHTLWVHPMHEIHFQFDGGRVPALDPDLIAQLENASNTAHGIDLDEGASLNFPALLGMKPKNSHDMFGSGVQRR